MATIQRPTKQGNATTYQGKVAAGYTTILASEMDADLDLMYSAWNQGVDGSNIQPGVITGNMLAPGAVGTRELQDGGVQTIDIGDGQVTNAKISDVAWSKLSGGTVAAGGDLGGTFPAPSLGTIQGGILSLNPRGSLITNSNFTVDLWANAPFTPSYDGTKPSWLVRVDYTDDAFQISRSPPPGQSFTPLLQIWNDGKTYCTLSDKSVARPQLQVNGIIGGNTSVAVPSNFALGSAGTWTPYATLPAITTRGGFVWLVAQTNLSVTGPAGGALVAQRWLRDGSTVVITRTQIVAGPYAPPP